MCSGIPRMSKPNVHMLHNKLVLLRSARNFSRKCQISENIKHFCLHNFYMQRRGRWVGGSGPRAAPMLSVHPHNQGATFAPQMLGFHGDTGIYQTVISSTRNKTSEHVHVCTWERAWPREALCTGRKLANKHQDECTPAPELRDGGRTGGWLGGDRRGKTCLWASPTISQTQNTPSFPPPPSLLPFL